MNYAYWFASAVRLSCRKKKMLIEKAGSAEDIYFLSEERLRSLVGEAITERVLAARKTETEAAYEKLGAQGITLLTLEDDAYPKRLREIWDPPYALYLRGRLPDASAKCIAVVGARMCSEYGRAVAKILAERLALHGVCVISGLALGTDAAGHRGALAGGGMTCAVLGCGIDVCYPGQNRELYDQILERGGILSEYPPGTQPLAGYFPQRNRIISGMSDAVVVVEAKERSGSLITADLALEQGRDVYAVPGRLNDTLSAGCNRLIAQGAGIVFNIEDFLKDLGIFCGDEGADGKILSAEENLSLEKEERLVYSCVDLRPRGPEELLNQTGLSAPALADCLVRLQQKGLITEIFKNAYIRNKVK